MDCNPCGWPGSRESERVQIKNYGVLPQDNLLTFHGRKRRIDRVEAHRHSGANPEGFVILVVRILRLYRQIHAVLNHAVRVEQDEVQPPPHVNVIELLLNELCLLKELPVEKVDMF